MKDVLIKYIRMDYSGSHQDASDIYAAIRKINIFCFQ